MSKTLPPCAPFAIGVSVRTGASCAASLRGRLDIIALLPEGVYEHWFIPRPRSPHTIKRAHSWSEVHALVAGLARCATLIEPCQDSPPDYVAIREFRAAFPSIPILALARASQATSDEWRMLGQLGVSRVIDGGLVHTVSDIAAIADTCYREMSKHAFMAGCAVTKHSGLPLALAVFLASPRQFLRPNDLARLYGRHAKTLRVHLADEGLPSTERLVQWMRLFVATSLLGEPGRSTSAAARAAGFPSMGAFAAVARRYLGAGVKSLAAKEGATLVCAAFVRERQRKIRGELVQDIASHVTAFPV